MIALDTNVLVRFLVRDDEHQANRARNLVEPCRATGDTCLVTSVVSRLKSEVNRLSIHCHPEAAAAAPLLLVLAQL